VATTREFRLGRDAVLTVDGRVLQSIVDETVRVVTDEMSVANGVDVADATLVYRRTIHLQFTLLDTREALYLGTLVESQPDDGLPILDNRPRLVVVELSKGHVRRKYYATIHELDEDRGIRGVIATRWFVKQWGKLPLLEVGGDANV
jgi:hypothetical protein